EYRLKPTDPGVGCALKDISLPKETLVTAIIRQEQVIIPSGATVLETGDKVIFMGLEAGMRKLEHRYNPHMGGRLDVIIVGGGNVGFMLAELLAPLSLVKLKIVEKSPERCKFLAANLPDRVLVLHADGTDVEFLTSLQIQNCHCLVASTGTDERNLLVSLLAKQLKVPNVITQTTKPGNVGFFEKVGVDVALSAHYNAIKNVVRKIDSEGIDVLTIIEKGQADIVEVVVPSDFQPRRLMDLHLPTGVIIAAIRRSSHTIVPHGSDKIKPKDHLRVFCTSGRGETLAEYLTETRHQAPAGGGEH
ncbi:MAG TPA: TrkA C-terminal domain-containing protein, partial [Candidatus Ozemobacteraceae bacterium]|nr:TrkA C-terminal domain-containing protein [Candidatus Ozemobacteraceae bacterium]